MSDKEKEAIKTIKFLKEKKWYLHAFDRGKEILSEDEKQDIDIALNLIEKQSKEIEELKENNKTLKNLQNDTNRLYIEMIERKNYFERESQKVVDKIKAKIEEVSNGTYDAKIVLQSLLEKE